MSRGPLGGPRPFADCEIVMNATVSIGALDQIEEGKRSINQVEVAEIEDRLRKMVLKSFATGPADYKIDVKKSGKNSLKIYLGDKVGRKQIRDIESIMENMGFKIADWTIQGE